MCIPTANQMKQDSNHAFIKVYSTPNSGQIVVIKSLLEAEKISYYIKGEHFARLYGAADGLTTMDVMVREDDFADAKELLKDFIEPQNK
jgi:hypothetical protein